MQIYMVQNRLNSGKFSVILEMQLLSCNLEFLKTSGKNYKSVSTRSAVMAINTMNQPLAIN